MIVQDFSNDGFTLIELIISIAIISILILGIYNLIFLSTNAMKIEDEADDYLVSGTYVVEYISDEIRSGDYILPSYLIKNLDVTYPYNLKFVILNKDNDVNYYITYYFTGKEIVRLSYKTALETLPEISKFDGYNKLDIGVSDIGDSGLDLKNDVVYLDLTFGDKITFKVRSAVNVENKIVKWGQKWKKDQLLFLL